jgi:hypothetical protein
VSDSNDSVQNRRQLTFHAIVDKPGGTAQARAKLNVQFAALKRGEKINQQAQNQWNLRGEGDSLGTDLHWKDLGRVLT